MYTTAMPGRKPAPLYRNISFTLMWTSTAASGFGDRMIMLGALALLGGLAAGQNDSTAIQASTQFWFFLPYLVFTLIGGYLADKLPRKWLMLGCDESRSLLLLLACWLLIGMADGPAELAKSQHWKVYAILTAVGVFAAIFNPTRNAIIPQIVPKPQLQAGNAIILVINVVASMIGMVLGGFIISPDSASSVQNGLLLGAAFYFTSGWFFAFLKPRAEQRTTLDPAQRRFGQALRYAFDHRRVLILIGLNILVWASAAAVSSALLGIGRDHYGLEGDELLKQFTFLSATLGVGMLVGAAIITLINTRRESTTIILLAVLAAGVCVFILAAVTWLPVTYAAALGVGTFGNIAIVGILTLLQSITPNHIRGRVMGLNALVNTAFSILTYFAIWRLPNADRNIIIVLYLLGPGLCLIALFGLVRFLLTGPGHERGFNLLWRINRLYALVWHRLRWIGRHHIPHDGPIILAANHTAGVDPMLIQAVCPRHVRWLMYTSYRFKLLEPMWKVVRPITLDDGRSVLPQMRSLLRVLKDDQIIGVFPEGGLQRTHRELQPFEPGIALLAARSGAMIVPAWIAGTPCRQNMLWHFLQPSHSVITFGQPFTVARDADTDAVLSELRQRMEALRERMKP